MEDFEAKFENIMKEHVNANEHRSTAIERFLIEEGVKAGVLV
jgi:hypothetical protein